MSAVIAYLLGNRYVRWLGLALAAIAGLGVWGRARENRGDRRGAQRVSEEAARETVKRVEDGNAQVERDRDLSPDERLRRNDGAWKTPRRH